MLISHSDIIKIRENEKDNICVSIFIPTHRTGHVEHDKLSWKNACTKAANQLLEAGMEGREIRQLLEPANSLLKDTNFWLHLSDGLCMFLNDGYAKRFVLPVKFDNMVLTDRHFLTLPLFMYLNDRLRYFIFDFSLGHNRFYEANKSTITDVHISDLVPESAEVLKTGTTPESGLNKSGAHMYHGKGDTDYDETIMDRYARDLAKGLEPVLSEESTPLILSGPEKLVSMFRQHSGYRDIMDEHIKGSNDHLDPVELHNISWSIIMQFYRPKEILQQRDEMNDEGKLVHGKLDHMRHLLESKNIARLVLDPGIFSEKNNSLIEVEQMSRKAESAGAEIQFDTADSYNLESADDVVAFKYYNG